MKQQLNAKVAERLSILREYEHNIDRLIRASHGLAAAENYIKNYFPRHKFDRAPLIMKALDQMQKDVRLKLVRTKEEQHEMIRKNIVDNVMAAANRWRGLL